MKKNYTCKNCGKIFTSDLGVCPECLTPVKKVNGKRLAEIIAFCCMAIVPIIVIVSLISVDYSETAFGVSSANSSVGASASGTILQNLTVGSTLSAKGLNITLVKVENWESDNQFIQPKNGKKFIRAYFKLENTNNSSRYLGSFDFTCYADNVKTDMSVYGDIYGGDSLALGTEVSGGRILQGYIYYEVPINAKSIQIEYDSDWWGSQATFIVK